MDGQGVGQGRLSAFFKCSDFGTDLKTELIAGFTTFATMAYIIAVVPGMLSSGGVPKGEAFTVTVVMTVLASLVMGLYTNRPFMLGPGLGSVAIFSFTLLKGGVPLSIASGIVFISGVIFILVSVFGVREFIVTVIPPSVKVAVGAGIGLFIALLGFKHAGIIVANPGKNVLVFGDLTSAKALLSILGFFLVLFFTARKVKGGIIFAVLLTTLAGIPFGVTRLPGSLVSMPSGIDSMMFNLDITGALSPKYLPYLLAFFIPDFFSTLGTLLAVGAQAGYLDEKGDMPGIDKCFYVDSGATAFGSFFSCPVLTTYLESSAGVEAGGRTGLTTVVASFFFLLTLFFSPIALMIPSCATSPVLMYIGISMLGSMRKIDYSDMTEYIPAFVCVTVTIFSFNAGNGIAAALVVYAFLKLVTGAARDAHWSVYAIALLMIYYFRIIATH
ncbi:NCS2 family permease [Desulfoluna butyratoxydans]|uniref:Xanthine/uracil/vitamin c permease n=1 Tax=Desulfoluna butyratoxydans TaxID=231438 RepID=A0A4U8YU55_9BACT|nr:NCS2 family permease [Desulfoluna butyratoxydans]VFQ44863.1 xanthine/uracil/vitamin c permease [Desulfoluna butyratoxydans]